MSKTSDSVYEKPIPSLASDVTPRPWLWSIVALIIAVVAVGLACIPALALERPLPNPFAATPADEKPRVDRTPKEEPAGGLVVVKFKKWSFTLGGKKPSDGASVEAAVPAPPAAAPVSEGLKLTRDPARWFTIAAVSLGLIGIVVASVGQLREKHTALTACSMSVCAAAIAWQYVAIGIAVGVAAAVFLLVLLLIASVLGGAT